MVSPALFLVIAAVVCWCIAAFNPPSYPRLVPAGLALCGIAYLFAGWSP